MTMRRFHYEQAFEYYLRIHRVPYVAVDEARKALLPPPGKSPGDSGDSMDPGNPGNPGVVASIKSFDFVVYAPAGKYLVDIKGRMFGTRKSPRSLSNSRLESWVTREDVEGLGQWQKLFGEDFRPIFVFAYCLRQQPPDALFEEIFTFQDKWYALREVDLGDYRREMVLRSERWQTVHVPKEAFLRISRPFSVRNLSPVESSCEVFS